MGHTTVEFLTVLNSSDEEALGRATNQVITSGSGIGWLHPLDGSTMNAYWQAVLKSVQAHVCYLCVARLNSVIVGSMQLYISSNRTNSADSHAGRITKVFVAPSARNMGLARRMLQSTEDQARNLSLETLELDVRSTQVTAVRLYESLGYERWGVQPYYAKVDGKYLEGYHYVKLIRSQA